MARRVRIRLPALVFALRLHSSPDAGFFEITVVCPMLLVSGNANNGALAGFVYSNVNNAPSNANTNVGSRLNFQNLFTGKDHASWQKTNYKKGVGTAREGSRL